MLKTDSERPERHKPSLAPPPPVRLYAGLGDMLDGIAESVTGIASAYCEHGVHCDNKCGECEYAEFLEGEEASASAEEDAMRRSMR